jgi:hypothetical protein
LAEEVEILACLQKGCQWPQTPYFTKVTVDYLSAGIDNEADGNYENGHKGIYRPYAEKSEQPDKPAMHPTVSVCGANPRLSFMHY